MAYEKPDVTLEYIARLMRDYQREEGDEFALYEIVRFVARRRGHRNFDVNDAHALLGRQDRAA